MHEKNKNEQGAIMLEAVYCILIVIIVFMFLLSFGFYLYQKTVVGIVANDIAEEISRSYKFRNITDDSSIDVTDISGIGKYRYFIFSNSFKSNNETKAYNLANTRLSKNSFAKRNGGLSVKLDTVVDDIGRRHYVVTLKQKYNFLFEDMLTTLGIADINTIEATAYAESVDVLHYVNMVRTTKYGIGKVKDNSSVLGLIDKAIKLLHTIFE